MDAAAPHSALGDGGRIGFQPLHSPESLQSMEEQASSAADIQNAHTVGPHVEQRVQFAQKDSLPRPPPPMLPVQLGVCLGV